MIIRVDKKQTHLLKNAHAAEAQVAYMYTDCATQFARVSALLLYRLTLAEIICEATKLQVHEL
jgi:hypothetical protein